MTILNLFSGLVIFFKCYQLISSYLCNTSALKKLRFSVLNWIQLGSVAVWPMLRPKVLPILFVFEFFSDHLCSLGCVKFEQC
jgi:hypothetical protein